MLGLSCILVWRCVDAGALAAAIVLACLPLLRSLSMISVFLNRLFLRMYVCMCDDSIFELALLRMDV